MVTKRRKRPQPGPVGDYRQYPSDTECFEHMRVVYTAIRNFTGLELVERIRDAVAAVPRANPCRLHGSVWQPLGPEGCGGCLGEIEFARPRVCCQHSWDRMPCPGHEPPDCKCACHKDEV